MFAFLFQTELVNTTSPSEIEQVERLLRQHQIDSTKRLVNRNYHGLNRRVNRIGSVGERGDLQNQYYLYVHNKDAEEAEYLLSEWRRNRK